MLTSNSPKAPQPINAGNKPKPKRPLSGYNLFYRFKRNKVLEATAHAEPASDTKAIIDAVLATLPGLENVNAQDHPLWTSYPPKTIDKLRASNIRSSMEGKLLPNGNVRNRLHRKSHGMGFVEMGKTMREMWANVDAVTKEVFCELADVGRARYKTLVAEWKVEAENDGLVGNGGNGGNDEKVQSLAEQSPKKRLKTKQPNSNTAVTVSPRPSQSRAVEKPKVQSFALPANPANQKAQVQAASNPKFISFPSTSINSSNNSNKRRFGWDSLEPIPIGTRSHVTMAHPASADLALAAPNKPRFARRVSDHDDLDPSVNSRSTSTAYTPDPVVIGSRGAFNTPASVVFGDSSVSSTSNKVSQEISKEFFHEYQQFLLKNAMILQNSFLENKFVVKQSPVVTPQFPPFQPALPVQQQQHQQDQVFSQNSNNDCGMMPLSAGESSYLDIISSRYSMLSNNVEVMPPLFENNQDSEVWRKEEVSDQDFEELVGLAETPHHIKDDDDHTCSSEEGSKDDWFDDELSLIFGDDQHTLMERDVTVGNEPKDNVEEWDENDLSFIFGKPMNDTKMNANTSAIPMPAAYELNNKRALMA